MLKVKKTLSHLVFLLRYSWGISKRLFAASAISIVLDTVEPFVLLILPKFIIDELTGLKRWDIVLPLYSSFDRSDGAHSGGQAAVFRFYQHVCQPGGYADRDPLFPLFSLYGL